MNNPNRHNNFTHDDVMDRLDEEADDAIKLDIEAEAKKTKEAIWEEGMSGSEKKQANEDWRDYLDSRPGSGEDLNLEDSFDAYDNEQVDSRAEFLSKASYVELALAARNARESDYDARVSDEILMALEDRVVVDSKYDLLDPEFEIGPDHPEYKRREEQLNSLIEDMSVYYAIADPENDPSDYIDDNNELLVDESGPEVVDSNEVHKTPYETARDLILGMTISMEKVRAELDTDAKEPSADSEPTASPEASTDENEAAPDSSEAVKDMMDVMGRVGSDFEGDSNESAPADEEHAPKSTADHEDDVDDKESEPDEGEGEGEAGSYEYEEIDFDNLELDTMAQYRAHKRGINQRRRAELRKVPRSNKALRHMINSIAIKQKVELKNRLTPEVAGSIKAKVYLLSGNIRDGFRMARGLKHEMKDELEVAKSDFTNQDKLLSKIPDAEKRKDARKLARREYNEQAESIKKRYKAEMRRAKWGSNNEESETADQDS